MKELMAVEDELTKRMNRPHTQIKISQRTVQMVPYDPLWPILFEAESKRIKKALGNDCIAVHHFGSTAVPGLCAKPKIDILAVVKSFSSLKPEALVEIGYEVRRETIPTGKYFTKENPRFNLHVFEDGNPLIEKDLKFRDWLRTHPEDREAYAALKKELAPQFNEHNGMAYCRAKTGFIEKIIKASASHQEVGQSHSQRTSPLS
ncbi:MAG: GrpB family protein [Parachlamydiales bacterium]|nr:GrpB family protein [Parachlamydiales bacterium]